MALLIASRRWGDDSGTNYRAEALKVLAGMLKERDFRDEPPIVTYLPTTSHTETGAVLPHYYSEWACLDVEHQDFWLCATIYARSFLHKAANSITGLAPARANLDGTVSGGAGFDSGSWTVPMNLMMDYWRRTDRSQRHAGVRIAPPRWGGHSCRGFGMRLSPPAIFAAMMVASTSLRCCT